MQYINIYTQQDRTLADGEAIRLFKPKSWTAWRNRIQQLRDVTTDVLALAGELRKGTIEKWFWA